MNKLQKSVTALGLVTVGVLFSPVVDQMQDSMVWQAAITRTCWQRAGFDPISRYSCRSSLFGVGPVALAFACAFNKDKTPPDICANFTKVAEENKQPETPAVVTNPTPTGSQPTVWDNNCNGLCTPNK